MKRIVIGILLLLVSSVCAAPANMIVFLTDDQGYNDVGCFGSPNIKTPNFDRMAEEGIRFTSAYVGAPVCGPSRSALLTGSYPIRIAEPGNKKNLHTVPHTKELMIPEVLKPSGYTSAIIGKWHAGEFNAKGHPLDQGFDYFFGTPKYNGFTKLIGDTKVRAPLMRNREVVIPAIEQKEMDQLTTWYTEEAIQFITKNKNNPFFLYLAHNMPHVPLGVSEKFRGKSEGGFYGDVIMELDWSMGEILKTLKALDLDENTLVVFISDNGPWIEKQIGDHAGHADPLRGAKMKSWEGGPRVPCIMRWPGKIPAGKTSEAIVTTMDLMPTFAELAGASLPEDLVIDGKDLKPLMTGVTDQSPHEYYYYYCYTQLEGIRDSRWKLVLPRPAKPKWMGWWGRMIDEVKEVQLFDLKNDISESTNVADKYPEIVGRLMTAIEKAREELGDRDRIGKGERFYDPDPKRPDIQKYRAWLQNCEPASEINGANEGGGNEIKKSDYEYEENDYVGVGFDGAVSAFGEVQLPNIVLIYADDLGYGDVGCYGATKVQTPNIDKLAAEGRRFTDAHSASAVCTPSRYALLTGEYPMRARVWGPCSPTSKLLIDTDKLTIASLLKKKGYDTSCFGKWHLGFGSGVADYAKSLRPGPLELGFDYYFGVPVVNSAPPYVYVENDHVVGMTPDDPIVYHDKNNRNKVTPLTPLTKEHGNRVSNWFSGAVEAHKLYNDFTLGTTLAGKATEWIRARKDNPFFLYLATTNIHHPITPHPRFQGTSQCGLYGDFIHELDWIVGEVMKALEEKGVADNTLFIFTSDNGGMFNDNGQDSFKYGHRQNGDLLGFKFGAWEGGHRIPFIARWPGRIKPGTTSQQLICSIDMLASFAAITGQTLDKQQQADSVNVLPALIGDPTEPVRKQLVLAPAKPTHLSVRRGKWMFIDARGSGGFSGTKPGSHGFAGPAAASFTGHPNSDVVDGKIRKDAPPAQLYDLEADVNQTKNLYTEYPEVVKEMRVLLQEHRSSVDVASKKKMTRRAAPKIAAAPSKRSVSLDFESGKLEPWKVVDGSFGHIIGNRDEFFANNGEFNKQGMYYLTTLEASEEAATRTDKQTGVIVSPLFIPKAGRLTFRVGGGAGPPTYVALCTAEGKEVELARGINGHLMQSASWDLTPYAGKKMYIKIVDQSTGGWGHITADNFQFDAELLEEYPE